MADPSAQCPQLAATPVLVVPCRDVRAMPVRRNHAGEVELPARNSGGGGEPLTVRVSCSVRWVIVPARAVLVRARETIVIALQLRPDNTTPVGEQEVEITLEAPNSAADKTASVTLRVRVLPDPHLIPEPPCVDLGSVPVSNEPRRFSVALRRSDEKPCRPQLRMGKSGDPGVSASFAMEAAEGGTCHLLFHTANRPAGLLQTDLVFADHDEQVMPARIPVQALVTDCPRLRLASRGQEVRDGLALTGRTTLEVRNPGGAPLRVKLLASDWLEAQPRELDVPPGEARRARLWQVQAFEGDDGHVTIESNANQYDGQTNSLLRLPVAPEPGPGPKPNGPRPPWPKWLALILAGFLGLAAVLIAVAPRPPKPPPPDPGPRLLAQAWQLHDRGEDRAVINLFSSRQEDIQTSPSYAEAQMLLGWSYARVNSPRQSQTAFLRYWQCAPPNDPKRQEVRQALARLRVTDANLPAIIGNCAPTGSWRSPRTPPR